MRSAITCSLVFCCALTFVPAARGQTAFVDAMVKHWTASKKLTLAVADAMPEDQYTFKATPAEMSFGQQMNHIAKGNGNYCAAASGQTSPVPDKPEDTKLEATKNLTSAFDFCIGQLQKLTDADLMKTVGKAPRQTTAFEAFWGGFTHTAHHRGQAEVYLRLKDIKPPSYTF